MEEKKRRGRRTQRKRLYTALMILSLIVFCVCLIQLVRIFLDYKAGSDSYQAVEKIALGDSDLPLIEPITPETQEQETAESEDQAQPEVLRYQFNGDVNALKAQNPDFIGWIYVPGTDISYPMVQGEDNNEYLRTTFEKTANNAGSIFLDSVIEDGLDAKNPIIYGHNRRDGSMFATLKRFQKQSFFEKYRYIYIFTTEGDRIYEVFSVYVTMPDSDTYTYGFGSEESFLSYIDKVKSQSLYDTGVSVEAQDNIITLSTCTNRQADTRFVVQAKRIQ